MQDAQIYVQDVHAKTMQAWLTPKETALLLDQCILALKSIYYYCLVDNKTARDAAIHECCATLSLLADSIETDGNDIASNLQRLLYYIVMQIKEIRKSNNASTTQEVLATLEPIRNALL